MMRCSHNVIVHLGEYTTICPTCNKNAALKYNRMLLTEALGKKKNCSPELKKYFGRLLDIARPLEGNKDYLVIEMVSTRLQGREDKAFFLIITGWTSPQLVYHDKEHDRLFVFNLFVRDQGWNKIEQQDTQKLSMIADKGKKGRSSVTEITAGQEEERIHHIPIALIEPDPKGQSRLDSSPYFRKERIQELAQALIQDGQRTPIQVKPVPKGGNTVYRIVTGERRYRAALMAGTLSTLKAYILSKDASREEVHTEQVTENANRAPLTFVEIAVEARRLMKECEWSLGKIAIKMGEKEWRLRQLLPIAELHTEIIHLLNEHSEVISPAQAVKLMKLKTIFEQKRAIQGWVNWKKIVKTSKDERKSTGRPHRWPTQNGQSVNILSFARVQQTNTGESLFKDAHDQQLLGAIRALSKACSEARKLQHDPEVSTASRRRLDSRYRDLEGILSEIQAHVPHLLRKLRSL